MMTQSQAYSVATLLAVGNTVADCVSRWEAYDYNSEEIAEAKALAERLAPHFRQPTGYVPRAALAIVQTFPVAVR